jgi:hypothetical protein
MVRKADGDLPARSRFGEGRLDHKLSPFGINSKPGRMGMGLQKMNVLT